MFLGKCRQLTLNRHLSHLKVIDLRGSKWFVARKMLWVSENFHMVLKSWNNIYDECHGLKSYFCVFSLLVA